MGWYLKNNLVISGCLLSRKVLWAAWIGIYCPKGMYFTYYKGSKWGPHENEIWLFSNIKMNGTNS